MPSSNATHESKLSTTNFDLPSLHLLLPEIEVTLHDAETHLSEFNDDEEQAPLLLDSIEVLKQLADVLDLISLDGASDLASAISASLQKLYDDGDNTNDSLILNISEGIMTLNRYIEFVLLKQTLVPTLLLPILNKLNDELGKPQVTEDNFNKRINANISIANPKQNYEDLTSLNNSRIDINTLSTAYRAGLNVVLTKLNGVLNDSEKRKVKSMAAACKLAADETDSLFWLAAAAATENLASIMPLTTFQKRTLIFLEQQLCNYLPADDNRFADLVSFAQQRNTPLAKKLQAKFADNRLDSEQQDNLRHFLFGPDRKVTEIVNNLVQDEIRIIKDKVDAFVRGDSINTIQVDAEQITERLRNLSLVMSVLMLDDASEAFKKAATAVDSWSATPKPQDFDDLLKALIVGENAAINLAKAHIPGAVSLPQYNETISLYQLDTAYETLVHQSRKAIAIIEQSIDDYLNDPQRDILNIQNIPSIILSISGALQFLNMDDGANMLNRLAKFLQENFDSGIKGVGDDILAKIADIIMAVDYHLEGFERKHPVGKQAFEVGHHSLNELLVA